MYSSTFDRDMQVNGRCGVHQEMAEASTSHKAPAEKQVTVAAASSFLRTRQGSGTR